MQTKDRFVIVYADNCQQLSGIAERLMRIHNATGWARTETSKQGRGEYTIKLKECLQ